ncbi:MAG: hypothetical protein ACOH5I_20755 [Oligoflexus sp.]
MISVMQAESMILENIFPSSGEWVSLQNLRDEWLTQSVQLDQRDPRFYRVTGDGIAIAWHIWKEGHRFFSLTEQKPVQSSSLSLAKPFEGFWVNAGDPLPFGTDCVVPVASVSIKDGMACVNNSLSLRRWDHVQRLNISGCDDQLILRQGQHLHSPEWAVAASLGLDGLSIAERPKISLFTVGWDRGGNDAQEQVDACSDSDESRYGILSSLQSHGFQKIEVYRLEDRFSSGRHLIQQILMDSKVLIFTDGAMQRMEQEKPDVLTLAGIEKVFRTVAQEPGSDFFFGLGPHQEFVFGLPKNPKAALIMAHRFILPALASIVSGKKPFAEKGQPRAILRQEVSRSPDMTRFVPVTIRFTESGLIEAQTIGDAEHSPQNLVGTDGFIELAPYFEANVIEMGTQAALPLWLWRQPWL